MIWARPKTAQKKHHRNIDDEFCGLTWVPNFIRQRLELIRLHLWLVGGFKKFLFSISYMGCHPSHIILPIDELIFFKMGTLHHQPGGVNIERDSQNLSGGIVVPIHRIKKSWTRTGDTWITGRQINVRYPAW